MGFKFVQLGGPKKTLILTSHYGPQGRPRQGAVVRDKIKIRQSEVYYFGNPAPTRHIASEKYEPWEIKGRFSDWWGGEGFAQAKKNEVKAFVADKQPLRITWDDFINVDGFIEEFDPGNEAEGEVEWQMVVKIDKDNFQSVTAAIPAKKKPSDHTADILFYQKDVPSLQALSLNGSVFDTFDSLISALGDATSQVAAATQEMQSFEESSVALLRRFRGALGQLKTAAVQFRDTLDSFTVDLAIERQNADDRLDFLSIQASLSASTLSMIRSIADADRSALLAERGQIKAFYVARGGDTWERISISQYGDAVRASDIRAANSIQAGQPPQPGATYQIPQ